MGIYLKVDYAVAEERAALRSSSDFGSFNEAKRVTQVRYHGAHKIHSEVARPDEFANFLVCSNDPMNASILAFRD